MVIAAIFLVPLVYMFNAFFLGRVVKRLKISSNNCFNTIIGFFTFFMLVYVFSSWIFIGKCTVLVYALVFGIVQAFLIVLYIGNWRYLFLRFSFNWKKFLTFFVAAGLTILIGFACFRSFDSMFGQHWITTIQNITPDIKNPIWFGETSSESISHFSAFNVLNVFWINCFNISGNENAILFCNWSWTICAGIIVGLLAQWITNSFTSFWRVFFSVLVLLFSVTITLALIESYAVPDSWVLLELTIYLLVVVQDKTYGRLKLGFLTILLISFLASSPGAYFLVIAVWLFTIYWAIRNKENSINYLICLSWPLMLSVFGLLSIFSYWLLGLMQAIYVLIMIISLIVFYKIGTPAWETRIAKGISAQSGKIVYFALGIFIAIIFIANFFIFHHIYHWNPDNIDYRDFLTFIYTKIWTLTITSPLWIAVVNSILYVFFVGLIIAFIVLRKSKNIYGYSLTKDVALKLLVVAAILFCNPLFIHILHKSSEMTLNTTNLNMLLAAPIFVFLLKICANNKVDPLDKWAYNWY